MLYGKPGNQVWLSVVLGILGWLLEDTDVTI